MKSTMSIAVVFLIWDIILLFRFNHRPVWIYTLAFYRPTSKWLKTILTIYLLYHLHDNFPLDKTIVNFMTKHKIQSKGHIETLGPI